MRFIHTADWQVGKVFRRFGEGEELFRRAGLDGVARDRTGGASRECDPAWPLRLVGRPAA